MIPGQLKGFIQQLKSATDSGNATWSSSPFVDGFTCEKSNISLGIWHFREEDTGYETIGFRVSDDIGETRFFVNEQEHDYYEMSNLYSSASASGNNFAQKLKNLFP